MRLIGGGGGWGRVVEAMNPIPCTCRGDDINTGLLLIGIIIICPIAKPYFVGAYAVWRMTRYIATLHSRNIFSIIKPYPCQTFLMSNS